MDKLLRNNNVVKAIALMIGILLWFVVHLDVNKTTTVIETPLNGEQTINDVKIIPTKLDETHFSLQKIDPEFVNITLKGNKSALSKLKTSGIQVQVDLSNATVGSHTYPLRAINVPNNFTATLVPNLVIVTLEELQKKEFPVTINVVGTAAAGYIVGQPIVNPNRVHVTLKTSELNRVDSVRAEVSVDKAAAVVSKQVKLTAYGKDGKPVEATISPAVVDVEIPITVPFKEMPLQVKVVGNPAPGFSIASMTQSVKRVTVFSSQATLDKMEFYDGPQVDVTDLNENKTITLDIPLKNKDIRVDPVKVEITLEIVPSTTLTMNNIPLRISGGNDSFVTKVILPEKPEIQAVLQGAPDLLAKLTLQDVQAIVDVSNLAPGQHELPINLSLPMFITAAEIQPQILKATVEIMAKVNSLGTPTPTSTSTPTIIPTSSLSPTPTPTKTPVSSSSP
jgi:YbbR domain-containing protein